MASFEQFLNSLNSKTKGIQFEHFVKWFLVNDPEWKTQVEQIWLWDEWPDRWGADCGIDLIFQHKNGDIWAVQAKCYAPEYSITKHDVDKFLSESNRKSIDKRLLIASTDKIGTNAKQVCKAQEKTVTHFLLSDFEQSLIQYPSDISELKTAKTKVKPKPHKHQQEAINDVVKEFQNAEHGQLIMACGTGKTFTTLWIKEELQSQTTLVLLPSLSLLSQTLREWTFASKTSFEVLCVCSDESVGKRDADETIGSVQDVSFPTTSDVEVITDFLQGKNEKVIFSTYQSSPLIAEVQKSKKLLNFDLVIADEAHRCTGESGSAFTTILDQSLIRANKRLFTTATPRTYSANLKKKADERGVEVSGMDDEKVFGKVFHNLSFSDAIEQELLTNYQVVIIGVDEPMIADWIQKRELVKTNSGDVIDAKSLAAQIGLIKAIKDYNLKRIISFHSRVKRAENFALDIQDAINIVNKEHKPKGKLWTDFVSGKMSTHKRRLKLDQLKSLTQGDAGILSNARCLSEGVDVPSLDGIAFIDPRSSQVDIVQAVGRAIRLSKDKTIGTIILPVFIENSDDAQASIESSNFKPIWGVINALKSHDEKLSFELDQLRTNMGKQVGSSVGNISKISFDLPATVEASFSASLSTFLVERTTTPWSFWYGLLQVYIEENGNTLVSNKYITQDGFALGAWVSMQRSKKSSMPTKRKEKLESTKLWIWDVLSQQWDEGFHYLEKYIYEYGSSWVPAAYRALDGFRLGRWVSKQRSGQDYLSRKQVIQLESTAFWTWDLLEEKWQEGLKYLKQYVDENNNALVPNAYTTKDGYSLGHWVLGQRGKRDKLSKEKIIQLESLKNWAWNKYKVQWEQNYYSLKKYFQKYGNTNVPRSFQSDTGFLLGSWIQNQRTDKDKLSSEQIDRLESLDGWAWKVLDNQWEENFYHLYEYVKIHKFLPEKRYKTEGGFSLGAWIQNQRTNRKKLPQEKIKKLESIECWEWSALEARWMNGFNHLIQHIDESGSISMPKSYITNDGFKLNSWVSEQKTVKRKGKMSIDRIKKLETIDGWKWSVA